MSVISIPEIKLAIYGYETLGIYFRVPVFAICNGGLSYEYVVLQIAESLLT